VKQTTTITLVTCRSIRRSDEAKQIVTKQAVYVC